MSSQQLFEILLFDRLCYEMTENFYAAIYDILRTIRITVMQMKLLLVEDLDDRQSDDNKVVFPNYTEPDIGKWTDDRDELSFPIYQLSESIGKLKFISGTSIGLWYCLST